MQEFNWKPKLNWYEPYKFMGRDLKVFWDRNGGKISTIAGTTGLFLTGAHACRKTYRIHDKLAENGRRISEAQSKRDKAIAVTSAVLGTAKDYLPDIVAGALSGYCVSRGWQMEHEHYEQATAMIGVIAGSFMNYRRNVIAEHGIEADRRYMTTKLVKKGAEGENDAEIGSESAGSGSADGNLIEIQLKPSELKILYSEHTTPYCWSPSHAIRLHQLEGIEDKLTHLLRGGGHYTVNDVRREFYGLKGDIANGGMFGRVWDPGNKEHPERGAAVNLHFREDEEFMYGLKDSCWIIIDIDDEPLMETLKKDQPTVTEWNT